MRAQDLSEIRFQARSKDQEILEEGGGAGLRKLDFFRFDLFLNSSATDIVLVTAQARQLKQQLRSALVAGQWRGDTALTLPLFWRRSTVSPIFFGRYPRSSLHSFVLPPPPPPPPPPSPSLINHLASVDIKQNILVLLRCVKVEMAVLGSPSLIVLMVYVDVKQH